MPRTTGIAQETRNQKGRQGRMRVRPDLYDGTYSTHYPNWELGRRALHAATLMVEPLRNCTHEQAAPSGRMAMTALLVSRLFRV